MAITATVTSSYAQNDCTSATFIVRGKLTLSGNYGTSGSHGDLFNPTTLYGVQSHSVPIRVLVYQQPPAGTAPGNCTGTYCPGSTPALGVISFANAGTELTGGSAYTGATSTAVWYFEAVYPVFV